MKTTVKNLSDTKVELTVTLGSEELADAEQVALSRLSKTIKVPGFRQGKVPVGVVAKHANPQELQESILDTAINRAVAEAFLSEKIQAIERPSVEVVKYVPGDTLEFTAQSEILPQVKLGDYKKLGVKRDKITVKDSEVDEVIERIRQGTAEKREVDRQAKDGDEVLIDFVGKKGDEAFAGGSASDFTLQLGSKQFIPGFEEGLIGHKAGESIDLKLKFPEDYHATELAGQDVVFSTTIKKVSEVVLPELNDELAKQSGPFESVADLKADIKKGIEQNKHNESTEKLKDDLIDKLIESSEVSAPEALVHDQVHAIEQDFTQNLLYRGLTLESYLRTSPYADENDWREKEVKPAAKKRVQASMLINELAKVENVQVSEDEVNERVAMYSAQYANSPETIKQLETDDARRDIANRLVFEKALDRLVSLNEK